MDTKKSEDGRRGADVLDADKASCRCPFRGTLKQIIKMIESRCRAQFLLVLPRSREAVFIQASIALFGRETPTQIFRSPR
jgi:hypothetical protein